MIHVVTMDQKPDIDMEGQVEGAILNGTEVIKCNSEENDTHRDGHKGIVRGSIEIPIDGVPEEAVAKLQGLYYGYFVEWINSPIKVQLGHDPVVFTLAFKVKV